MVPTGMSKPRNKAIHLVGRKSFMGYRFYYDTGVSNEHPAPVVSQDFVRKILTDEIGDGSFAPRRGKDPRAGDHASNTVPEKPPSADPGSVGKAIPQGRSQAGDPKEHDRYQ